MKKITVLFLFFLMAVVPATAFSADKGLHLGSTGKDAKKAAVEPKKTAQKGDSLLKKAAMGAKKTSQTSGNMTKKWKKKNYKQKNAIKR